MNKLRLFLYGFFFYLTTFSVVGAPRTKSTLAVRNIRVEHRVNPLGIEAERPRLSWQIAATEQAVVQTAYHILVASSPERLARNEGDLWDSGQVSSDASLWIPYAGLPLKSNVGCYWKVKVYTNKGESAWSEPGRWSMGLLGETHWRGAWIGLDQAAPGDSETQWSQLAARYLRKEFSLKQRVVRATVHLSGLGLYELFLNGVRVGDQVLAPAPTDYRKTVFYNSYDVTQLLKQTPQTAASESRQALGVVLGNGRFYTMRQHYKPYKIPNFGYPKLRLNLILEYADGTNETIVTDHGWKLTTEGPIRSNNEYDGELYDARKELKGWSEPGYDDSRWMAAQRVAIPDGTLRAQPMPGMKVTETKAPLSINRFDTPATPGKKSGLSAHATRATPRYILDLGQNMAGWMRIKIKGLAGDTIRLRFAETLDKEGNLYVENLRDARVTDTYIVSGREPQGATWAPCFVYHGFRYVEVTGYPNPQLSDFVAEVVEDEMAHTGEFTSSNKTLNAIVKNAFWGIRSNYKGMPVDCPQRNERQPWLGDRVMGCWGESYLFDNAVFYAKWADDIREAQRTDGCIPDVAPAFWNYYTDNVTWPAALPMVCDMLYTQYGNSEPMERNYPAIRRWIAHLQAEFQDKEGVITRDKYGDWCVPPEALDLIHSQDPARKTDGSLIATAYYLKVLQLMHRFATVQGLKSEADLWEKEEHRVKDAFNERFLVVKQGTSPVPGHPLYPDSVYYGNNTVTANILPLAFGLVPKPQIEEVVKQVVAGIITTNKGHLSTGVIGTQWLMRELSRKGHAAVAYLLATNETYPSWGYMAANGATSIWELWNGNTANPEMNSGNHVMLLGDLLPWCFENLAGIRPHRWRTGFKQLILKPNFEIQELSHIDASYETPYGKVISQWHKTPMQLEWNVEIPANTTAEVHLPDGRVEQIGSGRYHYSVPIPTRHPAITKDEFLYEQATFPECHSATLVETPNGDLVASYFGGTKERNPDCSIWVSRKPKGGSEWTAPVLAADGQFAPGDPHLKLAGLGGISYADHSGSNPTLQRRACWNPVLFQLPDGELLLFFKIGLKVSDWTGWLVRSRDGGKTWSRREPLPPGFLGPIKNKPEYIDGRIISPSSTEGSDGWRVHFEISDDRGKTWKKVGPLDAELSLLTPDRKAGIVQQDDAEAGEAVAGAGPKPIYAIQPSILRHSDGRLQILCRTRNGQLATAWSSDKGDSWSQLTLSELPSNNSGTDAVTLKDGRHVVIYNNFSTLPGTPKGVRTPLDLAISTDGIHWRHLLTLEDSPISQYSYPAIIQGKDGKLHALYTWRRQRMKYAEIDPTKF